MPSISSSQTDSCDSTVLFPFLHTVCQSLSFANRSRSNTWARVGAGIIWRMVLGSGGSSGADSDAESELNMSVCCSALPHDAASATDDQMLGFVGNAGATADSIRCRLLPLKLYVRVDSRCVPLPPATRWFGEHSRSNGSADETRKVASVHERTPGIRAQWRCGQMVKRAHAPRQVHTCIWSCAALCMLRDRTCPAQSVWVRALCTPGGQP